MSDSAVIPEQFRKFPPDTDESDVRWLVYRVQGEKGRHVIEAVDYMHLLKPGTCELKEEHAIRDRGVWVGALDTRIYLGPMGVTVRPELLHLTRKEAIEQVLRDLREQGRANRSEIDRWEGNYADELQVCPRCLLAFRESPRQDRNDFVCAACRVLEQGAGTGGRGKPFVAGTITAYFDDPSLAKYFEDRVPPPDALPPPNAPPCLVIVDANLVRRIAAEWRESNHTSNVGQQLFLLLATATPADEHQPDGSGT